MAAAQTFVPQYVGRIKQQHRACKGSLTLCGRKQTP